MIRFACPKCKTVLENEPGTKFSCPGCGQRLQAPFPPENKTVMGKLMDGAGRGQAPFSAPEDNSPMPKKVPDPLPPPVAMPADPLPVPVGGNVQLRIIMGREHVFWNCPLCQNPVDTPLDLRQMSVRCPHCSQKIAVPQPAGARMTPPATPPLEPESVTADQPEPRETSRPFEEGGRPRRRRSRFADYDDEPDDYVPSFRRGYNVHDLVRASASGLTCSLIGLGLLLIVFLLWIAAASSRPGRGEAFVFFILIAALGSFVLSLVGTIFSSRGLNPANETNRGQAVGGLVCGIIGLVLSSIIGLVFMCIGIALMSGPTRWWGW
jgi:DNA-directed RNA polymerase subunit RPC12/RpoP